MLRLVLLTAFVVVAFGESPNIRILYQRQEIDPNHSYNWAYETEHGIKANEEGSLYTVANSQPDVEILKAEGAYSYTSPEGKEVQITYVADENGFQPEGDVIPKVPEYILRALEYQRTH
nr:pupal cuticle protein-like [Onthophagus taurus]